MATISPLHKEFEDLRGTGGYDAADDWPVLNALFAKVAALGGNVKVDLSARKWYVSETLWIRGDKCDFGSFEIEGTAAMDRLVLLDAVNSTITKIKLQGTGSVNIATRTINDALVLGQVDGTLIGQVEARNFQRWAVESIGDATHSAVDCGIIDIYAVDCGSCGIGAGPTSTAVNRLTFSGVVRNSTQGNAGQTATYTIDSGDMTTIYPDDLIWIADSPHLVESVDVGAAEITCYNWPSHALTSGDIESGHGGCLSSKGGNTAALRALSIYGRRVGGLLRAGLYMGSDVQLTIELASYGVQIGLTTGGILYGGSCSIHGELAVGAVVVKVTRVACRFSVNCGAGAALDRFYAMTIHDANGVPTNDRWNTLEGLEIILDGVSQSASDRVEISYGIAPVRALDRTISGVSNKGGENVGHFAVSNTSNDLIIQIDVDDDAARAVCQALIDVTLEGIDDYVTRAPGLVTFQLSAAAIADGWTIGDPAGLATNYVVDPPGPIDVRFKRFPDAAIKTWLVTTTARSVA